MHANAEGTLLFTFNIENTTRDATCMYDRWTNTYVCTAALNIVPFRLTVERLATGAVSV